MRRWMMRLGNVCWLSWKTMEWITCVFILGVRLRLHFGWLINWEYILKWKCRCGEKMLNRTKPVIISSVASRKPFWKSMAIILPLFSIAMVMRLPVILILSKNLLIMDVPLTAADCTAVRRPYPCQVRPILYHSPDYQRSHGYLWRTTIYRLG